MTRIDQFVTEFRAYNELRLRQNKANILYDRKDSGLAIANLVVLSILANGYKLPLPNALVRLLSLSTVISETWQRVKVHEAIPSSARMEKALTHAIFPLLSMYFPLIKKITLTANLVGLARNSAPKLNACVKNILNKPLKSITGLTLHGFNLASQSYFTQQAFI